MKIWTAGAPTRLFRQQRILIVGAGQTAKQLLCASSGVGVRHIRWRVVVRRQESVALWRRQGVLPLSADLDQPTTLRRLAGISHRVLHLAPPFQHSEGPAVYQDTRTRALLQMLMLRKPPLKMVYASTTGVYGDCQGKWVSEQTLVQPFHSRAHRRVDAEKWVRAWGTRARHDWTILRVPSIYGNQREKGGPALRWLRPSANLVAEDDVYIHHIHMRDLAGACWVALWARAGRRVVNVRDDEVMKMGDWWDVVAKELNQAPFARVRRDQSEHIPLGVRSFMVESRKIKHDRMTQELRYRLRFPTVAQGLKA